MTEVAATAEAGAETGIADAPKGRDYEGEARKSGWAPKDEWKGDPDDWKTARQFVEYGEEKAEYDTRIERLEKSNRKAEAALKRQRDERLASLKAQKQAAVKAGNVEQVDAIDERIDAIKAEAEDDAEKSADEDSFEVVADWQLENKWYGTDKAMSDYAATISEGYANKHPGSSMKANLAYTEKKVREKFPDYDWTGKASLRKADDDTRANGHARVDGGGAFGGSGKRGKSASDLPSEAKAAADRYIKQGLYKDREAYAKDYFNEQ